MRLKPFLSLGLSANVLLLLLTYYFILQAQSTPQNDSKSSSPDTKRQKLDAENEPGSDPAEVTLTNEVENTVSTAAVADVLVDEEENHQDQQQLEQQPMIMDECRSENETPAQPPDADFGVCSPDDEIFQTYKVVFYHTFPNTEMIVENMMFSRVYDAL